MTLTKPYPVIPETIKHIETDSVGRLRRPVSVRELEGIVIQTEREFLARK